MSISGDRDVSVVVDLNVGWAPKDCCRARHRQDYLDRGPQRWRPAVGGSERRRGPIVCSDAIGHLAGMDGPRRLGLRHRPKKLRPRRPSNNISWVCCSLASGQSVVWPRGRKTTQCGPRLKRFEGPYGAHPWPPTSRAIFSELKVSCWAQDAPGPAGQRESTRAAGRLSNALYDAPKRFRAGCPPLTWPSARHIIREALPARRQTSSSLPSDC